MSLSIRACACCGIISPAVLKALAETLAETDEERLALKMTSIVTERMRTVREAVRVGLLAQTSALTAIGGLVQVAHTPAIEVFDSRHSQSLPGKAIAMPSTNPAASTVFQTTTGVETFYRTVLGRNSIDGAGSDITSSVRYGVKYQNAFWNGQQMVYGDGDGQIFIDFWKSPDVIGHELTHGVTQNESGLVYQGESGALNESLSDAFGAAFNQWTNNWPVTAPDAWLIGKGIMGPRAIAAGRTCLRDMADPGAAHCLSPQPGNYAQYDPTGDVHSNSGIPNKAFHDFAVAVGGNAYGDAIKVWYAAATGGGLHANATFKDFADLSVQAAGKIGGAALSAQAKAAWNGVGVV